MSAQSQFSNPCDYELKYPRDNEEFWLAYLDEAKVWDRDMVNAWNGTLNRFLLCVGAFSTAMATFISISSQSLQSNYTQIPASLMFEVLQLIRARLNGEPVANIPTSALTPNSPFEPSQNALLVNRLLFSSLTINICAAVVAIRMKQWLCAYMSPVSGMPSERVRVRQSRFESLKKWRVGLIIDFLLPLFLQLALGLFLIGLAAFVRLDTQIVWLVNRILRMHLCPYLDFTSVNLNLALLMSLTVCVIGVSIRMYN